MNTNLVDDVQFRFEAFFVILKDLYKVCSQRGKELNWGGIIFPDQIFYSVKAIFCYALNRFYHLVNCDQEYNPMLGEENIIMATLDGGSSLNGDYTSHWHSQLVVGHGYFKNWWVEIVEDAD